MYSKLIVSIIIILSISIYVLTAAKVFRQVKSGRRINSLWLLLILFFPIFGCLIYLTAYTEYANRFTKENCKYI